MAKTKYPFHTAVRVWKRDGSENYMDVEAAVANIHSRLLPNAPEKEEIEKSLLGGETIQTKNAMFRVLKQQGHSFATPANMEG